MVVMSVGACLGGDEPCREQIAEKQKSDLSGVPKRWFVSVNGVLQDSTDSSTWTVPGQLSRLQTPQQLSKG